jgi:PAS domain S-box-containing protein
MRRRDLWNLRIGKGLAQRRGAQPAPLPPDETERLETLRHYAILDTPPEQAFERITALAARLFQVPIALVTFVDEERQWFKSCHGLDTRQTDRGFSFCAHAIQDNKTMVVPDATRDPRFAASPLVTGPPGIRFYAGAPLKVAGGHNLGTLCILDTAPRASLSRAEQETLQDLAAIVVDEMELRLAAIRIREENDARRRIEETLREAKEALVGSHEVIERERRRYEDLLAFAPDGYLVTDAEGNILEANEAMAHLLNIALEFLPGKPFVQFLIEQEQHEFRTQLRRLQTVDRVHDWEARIKPRGRPPIHAALTAGAVRENNQAPVLRWMIRDITERKRHEQERYRLLTGGVRQHAILLLDADGAILSWNRDAERTTGWQGKSIPGQLFSCLFPDEFQTSGKAQRVLRVASADGRFEEEGWCVRSDDTRYWASVVITPTRDNAGRLTGFALFLRDLTDLKQIRQQDAESPQE